MIPHWSGRAGLLLGVVLLLASSTQAHQGKGKPKLSLRSTPAVTFAPARVVVTAEVSDGADDYEDFYCAKVGWDWGDGSESSAQDDCDPYEAGKSQIRRRYSNEHRYDTPGQYEVRFSLRQGSKTVASTTLVLRIRDGVADR